MNPIPTEERHCPVCLSSSYDVLFHQKFLPVAEVRLLDGYEVRVCSNCGCSYAGHIPPQSAFDAYYRDLSKYEHQDRQGRESHSDRDAYRSIADRLVPGLPSPSARIVDIGCATGGLLDELRQRGFTNTTGIDPSRTCAEYAHKLYGVEVLVGTLSNMPKALGQVDVGILVGVLEHVRDVINAVAQVKSSLPEGGLLFVVVPDATGFIHCLTAPFQHFSTEHINFFSPQSLANLMGGSGFETVSVSRLTRAHGVKDAEPLMAGLFRVAPRSTVNLQFDNETGPALHAYVRASENMEQLEIESLEPLRASREPIVVWGVGTQTQRLLAIGAFDAIQVTAFVDSNPKYQGKHLAGAPILMPTALKGRRETIVICSRLYKDEIERQIRTDLQLPNEILTIYG